MLFEKLLNIAPLETGDMENELSLEKQMEEEIAMEAAIDDATFETVAFESVAALDVYQNVMIAMAEKECAVEGADAVAVYESFGMEAAKDVLARKAYAGWSTIKALIGTLLGWVKKILGFSVNMKKVSKSLGEKAKKMRTALNKVVANVGKKEISYEVRVYESKAKEAIKELEDVKAELDNVGSDALAKMTKSTIVPQTAEEKATKSEEFKTWLDATEEKNAKDILDILFSGLKVYTDNNKLEDLQKLADKKVKDLNKLYKDVDAAAKGAKDVGAETVKLNSIITSQITAANVLAARAQASGKNYVKVADYLFTDVKKFIAKVA